MYQPKSEENKLVYREILNIVNKLLEDQQFEIQEITNEVLAALKNDNLKDSDKQSEIQKMFPNLKAEVFNQLLTRSK